MNKIFTNFLIICFTFAFLSCEKEDTDNIKNSIVGTWQLTSVTIDGASADISNYPTFLQFQSNQIYQSYNPTSQEKIRGGWSYEGDMLNISVDLPIAYYILKVDAQNLSLKYLTFNVEGNIATTIKEFRRSVDTEIP